MTADGLNTHHRVPPELHDIASRLGTLSRDLDKQTTAAEVLDRDAVEKRHAYELAYARAFLTSTGSMDIRRYQAVVDAEREKFAAEVADQALRACKTRIATLRVQIDTGRSLGAAIRAEVSLANAGHTP